MLTCAHPGLSDTDGHFLSPGPSRRVETPGGRDTAAQMSENHTCLSKRDTVSTLRVGSEGGASGTEHTKLQYARLLMAVADSCRGVA